MTKRVWASGLGFGDFLYFPEVDEPWSGRQAESVPMAFLKRTSLAPTARKKSRKLLKSRTQEAECQPVCGDDIRKDEVTGGA